MVMSWRRWCGLCARVPDIEMDYAELNELPGLRELAVKWLSISARRKCPICTECAGTLQQFQTFAENIQHIQEMFNELRAKRPVHDEDIRAARRKWTGSTGVKEEYGLGEDLMKQEVVNEVEITDADFLTEEQQNEVVSDLDYHFSQSVEEQEVETEEVEGEEEEDDDMEEEVDEEEEEEEDAEYVDEGNGAVNPHKLKPIIKPPRKTQKTPKKSKENNAKGAYQKCRYCERKFRTASYLRAHERSHVDVKPGELPYSCEHCGKRFQNLSTLMAHVVVHSDDTPFQCDKCPKSFKNKTRLRIHMEIHSENKWICPICGLPFNSSHSFNKHKFVHSDHRRYKCPVCPKDFKKQTALKEHLISHTGLRPYSCPFCEKTFINGSSARLHKVKVHPTELAELEASGKSEEVNAKHRNLPTLEQLKAHVVKNSVPVMPRL